MRYARLFQVFALLALLSSCVQSGEDGKGKPGNTSSSSSTSTRSETATQTSTNSSTQTQTSTGSATSTATSSAVNSKLGVNLEGINDWSRLYMFADMAKSSRVWGSVDAPWDGSVPVDSLGWPTQDAGLVLAIRQQDSTSSQPYHYVPAGVYPMRFTGRADISSYAGITIRNQAHNAGTNTTTAEMVVGSGVTQIFLMFRNTSGGIRNLQVWRPGYQNSGKVFTDEFLAAIAPFGTLRHMDTLATNNNPVRHWSERTLPTSATQASPKGMAYEHAIELANLTGKDMWINIPGGATDDYVLQLARLLRANLNPNVKVYVEFSNELWNAIFTQTGANEVAAMNEAIAGDRSLVNGAICTQANFNANTNGCNRYWAGYLRVAKRIVRISQIFSSEFGQAAINTRIMPVLATHYYYYSIGEQQLKYIADNFGPPRNYIYGIAGAPYYFLENDLSQSSSLTIDQINDSFTRSLNSLLPTFAEGATVGGNFVRGTRYNGGNWTQASQLALARYYGIKSLAYEGGMDFHQNTVSLATKYNFNLDQRSAALTTRYISQWLGCGNDLFLYYSLTSPWGQWGFWGLSNDPAGGTQYPKLRAYREMAARPANSFTTCH